MAWRGPYTMLLLVSLATWLALALVEEPPIKKFERQHIAPPRTGHETDNDYCRRMMKSRRIHHPEPKHTNTFIHANINTIINVCYRGGTPVGGVQVDSNASFDLTTCQLPQGWTTPPYIYNVYTENRRIRIECLQGLPSHFVRII